MWNHITIKKYYALHTINRMVKDPVELNIRLLASYRGVDSKEIEQLTVKQLGEALKEIAFLKELPDQPKLPLHFRCNGSVYKAIILTEGLTGGQFIDFNSIGKDEKPEDRIYQMHELLAVMCLKREWQMKPPFSKYEYNGWEKTAEIFHDHLTMDIAYPFFVFFCNVMVNLQQPILDYSLNEAKKQMKAVKNLIKKSQLEETTSTNTGAGR